MDKFALVINSSGTPGTEICEYLLEYGHVVWGAGNELCDIYHSKFFDVTTDLANEHSVEALFDTINDSGDDLDLIINISTPAPTSPIEDISTAEFSHYLNSSVLGFFHILKHGRNFIKEDEGHIINIFNLASKEVVPNYGLTSASQVAQMNLANVCKEEWESLNIRFSNLIWGDLNQANGKNRTSELITSLDMVLHSPRNVSFSPLMIHPTGDDCEWN